MPSTIFNEFINFIVATNPKEILTFKASTTANQRYESLTNKEKTAGLSLT